MVDFVLRPVVTVLTLAVAAFGAGHWIFSLLSPKFSKLDKLALSWLGGLGVLSLALFIVGQWRFTRLTIGIVVVLASLCAIKPLFHLLGDERNNFPGFRDWPAPALIVVPILFCVAFGSLAEITGDWSIDAVVYHLLGPKVWIREGVIRPVPDNCHTAMPQTGETISAAAMAFGGPRAPGCASSLTFVMLLLVAAALARRVGLSVQEAWWAVLLIVTMPAVVTASTHVFVDGLYAAFVLASARVAFDAENIQEFFVAGVFAGLALGTKYTGLLAVPAVLLCRLLKEVFERRFSSHEMKNALVALATACVVGSPYYLRNWIVLGCPIYPPPPLLWRFFPARYLSTEAVLHFHAYIRQRGKGFGTGIGAFLLLPFNLTYHTSNFFGAGGIGICPLGLSVFGIVETWRNAFARTLAMLRMLLLVLWFVTQQESRFLVHGYVLSAIFAIFGWRYAESIGSAARILAPAIVVLSISYGTFMMRYTLLDIESVMSPAAAGARERAGIPFFESFSFINGDPAVKKVLVLDSSVPPYYLERSYVKPVGQWGERTLPGAPDASQALRRVREWGVSHVLDVQSEIAPFVVAERTPDLVLVFEAKNQRVYRVDENH